MFLLVMQCVYVAAAYNNTVVHVDWLASDDVTVFTLRQSGQFVDITSSSSSSSSSSFSCSVLLINSSQAVLVARLSGVSGGSRFMSLVDGLDALSSNYTFVAFRPQYTSDRHQLQHYLHVIVDKLSTVNNLLLDNRRLNATTTMIHWSERLGLDWVSVLVSVNEGTHRICTVDGRPLSGYVYGLANRSAAPYASSLASVTDPRVPGHWHHWPPPRDTHAHTSTHSQTTETLDSHVTDDETMTSSATGRSESSVNDDSSTRTSHAAPVTTSDDETIISRPTTGVMTAANSQQHTAQLAALATTTTTTTTQYSVTSASVMSSTTTTTTTTLSLQAATATQTLQSVSDYWTLMTHHDMTSPDELSDVTNRKHPSVSSMVTPTTTTRSTVTTNSGDGMDRAGSTVDVLHVHRPSETRSTSAGGSAGVTSMIDLLQDLPARNTDNNDTHHDDDDDHNDLSDHLFELFKTVFIYAGVPFICSLLVVWFLCSQTTLLKRQHLTAAAANDGGTCVSRDQAPASESLSSSGDCSLVLSDSSVDSSSRSASLLYESMHGNGSNYCTTSRPSIIVPLSAAYRAVGHGLSLDDDSFLLKANSKPAARRVTVTRSVDVDLLQQLAADYSRHPDDPVKSVNTVHVGLGDKLSCSGSVAAEVCKLDRPRLYVDTETDGRCLQYSSQQKKNRQHLMISLPHSSSVL